MKSFIHCIGNTPLIRLNHLSDSHGVELYGKCEFMNPSGSVKDRAAYAMIHDAIDAGLIHSVTTVIEPTSGNTGIALAMICSSMGIPLILTMPESMSLERRQLLSAYGATIHLTPAHLGMTGAVDESQRLKESLANAFIPQQFENASNPSMHYRTTGPEIAADLDVDVFVAGVGTGGTSHGVTKYLKEQASVYSVAVEPTDSPVLSGGSPGPHMIQGIGAGFVPKNYDASLVDEVVQVNAKDAIDMANTLAKHEGVFCGISAGANVTAALSIAKRPENKTKRVVTILCDTGERYLSMNIFNQGAK